jgi:hypothetical protein
MSLLYLYLVPGSRLTYLLTYLLTCSMVQDIIAVAIPSNSIFLCISEYNVSPPALINSVGI